MRTLISLMDIADQYDTYFFDMFGTIWEGSGFYPEVKQAFGDLKQAGKKIVLLSNVTMPNFVMYDKMEKNGLVRGVHFDLFLTSGEVFLRKIQAGFLEKFTGKKEYRFYIIGCDNPVLFKDILHHQTRVVEEADFIYIGSLDIEGGVSMNLDKFTPDMTRALALKKPAICANPDVQANKGDVVYLSNGAAARWYEKQGGNVTYFGKPYAEIFQSAASEIRVDLSKAVMVGDLVETDVLGANRAGVASVLITGTGVAVKELKTRTLEHWCAAYNACPDFILNCVR